MKKAKTKANGVFFLIAFILAVLAIPAGIISYVLYFAWDSEIEGNAYKVAFEIEGQLYELKNSGSGLAFDDENLYANAPFFLGELISLSFQDFDVAQTDNPFFAGKVNPRNVNKYYEQKTRYINPKDSVQSYTFYDQNHNQILTYEPETENEYVVKLRPTFPSFSKSKVRIGDKQDYLNVTKLLREKLNKNLKIKADETNKLLILSFEN
jgi:hypothetical protein